MISIAQKQEKVICFFQSEDYSPSIRQLQCETYYVQDEILYINQNWMNHIFSVFSRKDYGSNPVLCFLHYLKNISNHDVFEVFCFVIGDYS